MSMLRSEICVLWTKKNYFLAFKKHVFRSKVFSDEIARHNFAETIFYVFFKTKIR